MCCNHCSNETDQQLALRLGVSGMASSGCCAVATTAWYSGAPGRGPEYDVGGLTASWLQASPIASACSHSGCVETDENRCSLQDDVGGFSASWLQASLIASACTQLVEWNAAGGMANLG